MFDNLCSQIDDFPQSKRSPASQPPTDSQAIQHSSSVLRNARLASAIRTPGCDSSESFSSAQMESHKKQALLLMFLSSITGLTGNFLLASVGMLCGGMHYCNNGSAPDLMFMLSFMTAVVGLMYLFSVISFGTLMLFVSPERVCGVSTSLMERVSSEKAELPTNAGYWNMTEAAQGHIAYHTRSSPTAVKGLEHGEFSLMSCQSSPSPWPALFNCVHACTIHL